MSNLLEIGELVWGALFPHPTDDAAITKEEVITSCKVQYAVAMWTMARNERNQEGVFEVPSNILAQSEPLPVVNNEIDISGLEILRGLPNEVWLQRVGSLTSTCRYVKSTVNKSAIFEDITDGLPDDTKTYFVLGKKIIFPKGVHENKLPIIYATSGIENDGLYEVDDVVGGIIQQQVLAMYLNRTGKEDKSNDGNSN